MAAVNIAAASYFNMQAPTIRFVRGYYYVSTGVSLARRTDRWRPSFAHLDLTC